VIVPDPWLLASFSQYMAVPWTIVRCPLLGPLRPRQYLHFPAWLEQVKLKVYSGFPSSAKDEKLQMINKKQPLLMLSLFFFSQDKVWPGWPEFSILLILPPECWDYRCASPHQAHCGPFLSQVVERPWEWELLSC
jgi:hypothetical protein